MSLIAWYKLDGNALDSSGNNRNLTTNTATPTTTGKIGGCYTFASGNAISATSGINLPHNVSFTAWAYNNNAFAGNMMIFSCNSTLYSGPDLYFIGTIAWNTGDSAGNPFKKDGVNVIYPSSNAWHHYAVVNNQELNKAFLYIDGEYYGEAVYRNTFQENRGFTIGNYTPGSTGYAWAGMIDDVRIYNHLLTEKEIKELAKAKILHYTFDTEDASDNSGYDNHADLTLATTPQWVEDARIGKGAYYFDGTKELITNKLFFDNINQEWTATGWVKLDVNNTYQLFNNFNLGNRIIHSSLKALLYANSGTNDHYVYSSSTIPTNQWVHIAFVYRTSDRTCKFYLNGNLDASSENYDVTDVPSGFSATTIFGTSLQGYMDDVRIYATALSSDDIKELYQTRAQIDNKGNLYANQIEEDEEMWQIPEIGTDGVFNQQNFSEIGPTNGLVAYYPLNGDAKDYANANDGTVNGAIIAGGINGKACYSFDGVDDYIQLSKPIIGIWDSSFTFSVWAKAVSGSGRGILLGDYSTTNALNVNIEWSSSRLRLYWANSPDINASLSLAYDTWTFLTIVRDKSSSQVRFYKNGVLGYTYSGDLVDKTATTNLHRIGSDGKTGEPVFNGSIQNVRIYNRALSPEEISILYDLEKGDTVKAKMDKNTLYVGREIYETL